MRQKLTENALVESEGDNINGNKIARWYFDYYLGKTATSFYRQSQASIAVSKQV